MSNGLTGLLSPEPGEVRDLSHTSTGDFFNGHVVPRVGSFRVQDDQAARMLNPSDTLRKKMDDDLMQFIREDKAKSAQSASPRRIPGSGTGFLQREEPPLPSWDERPPREVVGEPVRPTDSELPAGDPSGEDKGLFGYKIRQELYEGEDAFFKRRPEVAGMAAGDGTIILNPNSPLSEEELNAVARNEALRLKMRDDDFSPQFEITPEQRKAFEGTEYGTDDNALRQTILARIHSGDPSALATQEQQSAYEDYLSTSGGSLISGGSEDPSIRDGGSILPAKGVFPQNPERGETPAELTSFVKQFEGWNPKAFSDYKQVSIGYGTKAKPGEKEISREEGEKRLGAELQKSRKHVLDFAEKHSYKFNDNQINALTSFAYNIGSIDELTADGTRTVAQIAAKIPEYRKAGGKVSKGLVRRRTAEQQLFNK